MSTSSTADKKIKKLYVLDTNVLLHDPTSIFRFHEHDVFLPMMVLEELDNSKKGTSDVARNARQVSRFLEEIIQSADVEKIRQGLPIPSAVKTQKAPQGEIFFQVHLSPEKADKPDNQILETTKTLSETETSKQVILVSKDINLRIKAKIEGIRTEDYSNDKVLDDADLLGSGVWDGGSDPWHDHEVQAWHEDGDNFMQVKGEATKSWYPNLYLKIEDDPVGYKVQEVNAERDESTIARCIDYTSERFAVWGVQARNLEQSFAFNALMDPEIEFVSLLGAAGTGKTLLTLAAGLSQVLDNNIYNEIIMTRITVPVGDDIGFLPGTEEEKMTPWMGALMDNLEVLNEGGQSREKPSAWEKAAAKDLVTQRIKIHSLNFMRGRTFQNKFLIIDEAQNLTSKQMKTLITRAGPGTKIVCLGNISQIDTPYLTETTSGLTFVVDRFRAWPYAAHVTLQRGERSRLAEFASDEL